MTDVAERAPLLGNDDSDPNQHRPSAESVEEEEQQPPSRQQARWNRPEGQFHIGRFTSLEKMLFILSVTLLNLLFVFIGLFARSVYQGDSRSVAPSPTSTPTVAPTPLIPKCETPKCVTTAADILGDLDLSVDPCDDFFAFTCNNWIKTHKIPDGQSTTGTMLHMFDENQETLHEIFESDFDAIEDENKDGLPNPERLLDKQNFGKAKTMYDSCMNESAINARGAEPIIPLLRDIRDSFEATTYAATQDGRFVEQDQKSSSLVQRLTKTIAQLANAGVNALFRTNIDLDLENPITYRVYLYQSGLTLASKEYYKQQDKLDALFETVAQTMDLVLGSADSEFGWNRWSANTTARLIVNFEKDLAAISDTPEFLWEPKNIYNLRTLSQLTSYNPNIDWDLLLSHILPSTAPHQDTVVVTSPEYMQRLSKEILEKSTDRTIQAYLLWRVIFEYVQTLGEDVRLPLERMEARLRGTSVKLQKPRWQTCLDRMQESMGFLMGRYFVQKRFNGDSKQRADEFVLSIKDAFKRRLPELTWLDEITKQRAMEKVDNVMFKIGYPTSSPDLTSPVSVSHYYSELTVQPDDYFGNYVNGRRWSVKKEWHRLGTDPDRGIWMMYPQEVNAYASEGLTEIVFPAGILQPPQFSIDYPDYLNYGAIGMVLGHELTHHFDPSGSLFDKDGRMVDWWTNETRTHFNEKTRCFIDQYSNYTVDAGDGKKLNVNGRFTQGENVADNGGIATAFRAWKATYKAERNMLLPGLDNFTPEQLFFISFGRNWCFKATNEALVQQVLTDEHAPKMLRVKGVIQNSKTFSEVFSCPVGSPMNPEQKCEIW